jgi:hypothetical protein
MIALHRTDNLREYPMKKKLRFILGLFSTLIIIRVSMVGIDTFIVGANPDYQSLEKVAAQTVPLIQLPSNLNLTVQQQAHRAARDRVTKRT